MHLISGNGSWQNRKLGKEDLGEEDMADGIPFLYEYILFSGVPMNVRDAEAAPSSPLLP